MQIDVKSTGNRKIVDFRKLGFGDFQVLGKYNYTKVENILPTHRHEGMIEICYCDKGKQHFEVGHAQYLVKGGDFFIHYPGEPHGSGGYPEEKGVLYWLIIAPGDPALSQTAQLCQLILQSRRRHFKGTRRAKTLLDDIISTYAGKEPPAIKKIRLHLMLQTFLLAVIDASHHGESSAPGEDDRIRDILAYLDDHLHEQPSIAQLAKKIHLSESRFKHLFKELTGFTPGDYIQRKKIELAVRRIAENPSLSITELAYELNFSSPQYFSTVMKKYTGSSPGSIKTKTQR